MNLLKMKIAQKLPLVLIGSALVVGVGIGIAAYMIGLQTVDEQRAARMDASVQSGLDQVQEYFRNTSVELGLYASRADTVTMIANLTKAFEPLDLQGNGVQLMQDAFINNNPEPFGERYKLDSAGQTTGNYDTQHKRFHPAWRTLLVERGYNDILLFNPAGRLIYSAQKFDDFATDFSKGSGNPLSEGELGKLYAQLSMMPAGP